PRRHRQHHRRGARRLRHRVHRELRGVARFDALGRVLGLRGADPGPGLPAGGHPRPARGRAGMSAAPAVEMEKSGKIKAPNGTRLRGWRGRISEFAHKHRSWTIVIGMAIGSVVLYIWSAYPPFSFVQTQN